jgi:cytoskeletal protein RodZ
LPDNFLDDLIREAADNAGSPSFREEDWVEMEQLLDKDKRRRFFFWWWLGPALLLLLAGAGYWFWGTPHNTAKGTTVQSVKTSQPVNASGKQTQAKSPDASTNAATSTSVNNLPTTQQPSTQQGANTTVATNTATGTTSQGQHAATVTTATAKPNSVTPTKYNATAGNAVKQTVKPDLVNTSNNSSNISSKPGLTTGKHKLNMHVQPALVTSKRWPQKTTVSKPVKNQDKPAVGTSLTTPASSTALQQNTHTSTASSTPALIPGKVVDAPADSTPKTDTLLVVKKADSVVKKDTATTVQPKPKPNKHTANWLAKLEFGLMGSADYTSVKLRSEDHVSWGGGITIGYAISKRFSIAAGYAVSEKKYAALLTDYKNPPDWGPRYYVDNNIAAKCLVYEVPLLLQYNFYNKGNNGFFATAGLSTYLMKSEDYTYTYSYYNVVNTATLQYRNQNNHIFSILGLGVGYRRQFTPRLALQAAPFIKMPLSGIGQGRVNLYSTGLQLSVHFRPWAQ